MAMGDVVLTLLLRREGLLPALSRTLDAFVACYSAAENGEGIRLAQCLRGAGLRVDRSLKSGNLGNQLRQAEASGARVAVILAPDELAHGEAVVRNLQTGEQATVTMGAVEPAVWAIAGCAAPEEV